MGFNLIYWTPMSGSYFLEKRPFFRADMAGLGKYSAGGYGRIGVYRDKHRSLKSSQEQNLTKYCYNLIFFY